MSFQATNNTASTQLKKDLLSLFQNRHPFAKCSAGVLFYAASRVKKVDFKEALEGLVADELLEKHTNQQGQLFYCLTTDPKKRETIYRLSERNDNGNRGYRPVPAFSSSQTVTQFNQLRREEAVLI